jgi:hemin uptake protein HemP
MVIDVLNENYYHSQITEERTGMADITNLRQREPDTTALGGAASLTASQPQVVRSEELLGRHGELLILHAGRQYRLRVTQNGKLILNA